MVFVSYHNVVEVNYGPLAGVRYDEGVIRYRQLMMRPDQMFYHDNEREVSLTPGLLILTRFTPPASPSSSRGLSARMLLSSKEERHRLKSLVQASIDHNIEDNVIANHDGRLGLSPTHTYTIGPLTVHGDKYIQYDGIRFYRTGLVERPGYNDGHQPSVLQYRWYLHAYNNRLVMQGGTVTYTYYLDDHHISAQFTKNNFEYYLTWSGGGSEGDEGELVIDAVSEGENRHNLSTGWGLPGEVTHLTQQMESMTLTTSFDSAGTISFGDHHLTLGDDLVVEVVHRVATAPF